MMTQVAAPTDIPLLQKLAALELCAPISPASYNLAELLGDQIDLPDSIALAQSLTSLDRLKSGAHVSMESPQKQWLNTRGGVIRFVLRSFESADTSVPFTLPKPSQACLDEPVETMKLYLRFYSLHQSEMDHRIALLRKSLRASLGLEGPALVRLANLDRVLDDTLRSYSAKVLANIPKLLVQHFSAYREDYLSSDQLGTEPSDWLLDGGWLYRFHQDMKQLLLAELDFRLLPARALLDALDKQDST